MSTRKSIRLPVVITFIIICIIIYLFTNIKQSTIVCEKDFSFDSDILLSEKINITLDNKKISNINLRKSIILPEKYNKKRENLVGIQNSLDTTLSYLEDKVSYNILDDRIVVDINVNDDELVLLSNLSFYDNNGELGIHIDANTKSSGVITLVVGDIYTDGELMKKLKNNGYYCK